MEQKQAVKFGQQFKREKVDSVRRSRTVGLTLRQFCRTDNPTTRRSKSRSILPPTLKNLTTLFYPIPLSFHPSLPFSLPVQNSINALTRRSPTTVQTWLPYNPLSFSFFFLSPFSFFFSTKSTCSLVAQRFDKADLHSWARNVCTGFHANCLLYLLTTTRQLNLRTTTRERKRDN